DDSDKNKSIISKYDQNDGYKNDQYNINNIFTKRQIEGFKKIFALKPIKASIKKEKVFSKDKETE
ncbi:12830_t:CDS:1, partial [Gigaspora margarita]